MVRRTANSVALFSTRNKSITFRLSLEEYEALRSYSIDKRVRISELAREALMQQISSEPSQRSFVSGDLTSLSSGLEEIDGALKQLSEKISKVLGPK
jgi:hypothetical protein